MSICVTRNARRFFGWGVTKFEGGVHFTSVGNLLSSTRIINRRQQDFSQDHSAGFKKADGSEFRWIL